MCIMNEVKKRSHHLHGFVFNKKKKIFLRYLFSARFSLQNPDEFLNNRYKRDIEHDHSKTKQK